MRRILDDDGYLLPSDLEHEGHRADEDLLAVLHRHAIAGRDALAADVGAVGAAAIFEEELAARAVQEGVTTRDLRVWDLDVVVGCAADGLLTAATGRAAAELELSDDRFVLGAPAPGVGWSR